MCPPLRLQNLGTQGVQGSLQMEKYEHPGYKDTSLATSQAAILVLLPTCWLSGSWAASVGASQSLEHALDTWQPLVQERPV